MSLALRHRLMTDSSRSATLTTSACRRRGALFDGETVQSPGPFDVRQSPMRVFTVAHDIEVAGDGPEP